MTQKCNRDVEEAAFPLLADPQGYTACQWDLTEDSEKLFYWLRRFKSHFPSLLENAAAVLHADGEGEELVRDRCQTAATQFNAYLDAVDRDPRGAAQLDILTICKAREHALRSAGIDDPYRLAKQQENEASLQLLPQLLSELDALDSHERVGRLIEGVLAGNIFDLGATSTAELFKDKQVDFHATRNQLQPRPWRIDQLDEWQHRLVNGPRYHCAILFVDNAGPDILLGMIPFARDLLQRGTGVILTANTTPALNDITHDELTSLVSTIATWDKSLHNAINNGSLTLVASGNGFPLIDLKVVSANLVKEVEARGVDLVVLEGMGRAIETNFDARFHCDALKMAMFKDQSVARSLGADLYDLMLRFDPSDRSYRWQ